MTITLTRAEVEALEPCNLDKLKVFGRRRKMNARQALEAGASIHDLLWVAAKIDRKDLVVRYALAVAQCVAHLTTAPEAQAALDAVQRWLDEPTDANAKAAEVAKTEAEAAWDVSRGVGAAMATWAAAKATWAAAKAAEAAGVSRAAEAATGAARATWAAEAAAGAAGAAARAAERAAQRAIFLEIFG